MVQIGRRVLSNYFKTGIRNRFYATNTCFLKNGVSRTPMWTRDFLALYHNIQIINRRLQLYGHRIIEAAYHNIQIINRRLQRNPSCVSRSPNHNIQIINRRLQPVHRKNGAFLDHNIQIINRRLQRFISIISQLIIITYKSLTGDYSSYGHTTGSTAIITYKSLTGDYSPPPL